MHHISEQNTEANLASPVYQRTWIQKQEVALEKQKQNIRTDGDQELFPGQNISFKRNTSFKGMISKRDIH